MEGSTMKVLTQTAWCRLVTFLRILKSFVDFVLERKTTVFNAQFNLSQEKAAKANSIEET